MIELTEMLMTPSPRADTTTRSTSALCRKSARTDETMLEEENRIPTTLANLANSSRPGSERKVTEALRMTAA